MNYYIFCETVLSKNYFGCLRGLHCIPPSSAIVALLPQNQQQLAYSNFFFTVFNVQYLKHFKE